MRVTDLYVKSRDKKRLLVLMRTVAYRDAWLGRARLAVSTLLTGVNSFYPQKLSLLASCAAILQHILDVT